MNVEIEARNEWNMLTEGRHIVRENSSVIDVIVRQDSGSELSSNNLLYVL